MPVSLEVAATAGSQSSLKELIGGFIHRWVPHDSVAIYSFSIIIFIVAVLWAICARKRNQNQHGLTGSDVFRVGFAAGPLPIYILLPLMPFDPDLTGVILNEPFQLLIAGAIGIVWTQADIAKIIGRKAPKSTSRR